METCKLSFDVTYDPTKTNASKLAELFDFMLGQSLGSDVLDGQGETHVGPITTNLDAMQTLLKSDLDIANAHLIAAAPDLLIACKLMAALPEENFSGCAVGEAIRAARAVIAKATSC